MADSNMVLARHRESGEERDVPLHWVDEKRSPFPGQWERIVEDEAPAPDPIEIEAAGDAAPKKSRRAAKKTAAPQSGGTNAGSGTDSGKGK